MSAFGPSAPSTVVVAGTGNAWHNPTFVEALDGNSADSEPWQIVTAPGPVIVGKDPYQSEQLHCTNFGLSVPSDYFPTRIIVDVWRRQTSPRYPGTDVIDKQVQIVVGGAATGISKHSSLAWDNTLTQFTYDYPVGEGGWQIPTLSAAMVNASDFGVELQCQGSGVQIPYPFVGLPAPIGYIDYVTITVIAERGNHDTFTIKPPYSYKVF